MITYKNLTIGQTRVTSRKLGNMMTGKVLGFKHAEMYANLNGPISRYQQWAKLYPGWRDDVIVAVLFDKPCKVVSFEEAKQFDKELTFQKYQNDYIEVAVGYYPIEDLIAMEDLSV